MLIKRIIGFQLRGPGPPGRKCTPTTGYFHDKTKISLEYLPVDYFTIYCKKQFNLLPTIWAKSLIKFNPKMQDFKRVSYLNCK